MWYFQSKARPVSFSSTSALCQSWQCVATTKVLSEEPSSSLSLPDRTATLKVFVPHTAPGWGDRLDTRSCVWCRKSNNWNFHSCLNTEQWGWLRREQQEFPSTPCARFPRKCCRNIIPAALGPANLFAPPCSCCTLYSASPTKQFRVCSSRGSFTALSETPALRILFNTSSFFLFSIRGIGYWKNYSPHISSGITALIRNLLKLVGLSSAVFNKHGARLGKKNMNKARVIFFY